MTKSTLQKVRDYWNARPCNLRHSHARVGSRRYFEEVTSRKYTVEPHILGFADFEKWRGKRVLEIGCGIGTDASSFAAHGADYTGIELSEKSLRLAKKRFALFGLKGRFVLGNAEKLSGILSPQRFDLVYSFGVIHHTPNPQAVVDGVLKYMDDQSQFRLMLYATDSWKNILLRAGLAQCEAQPGCPVARTFTRGEAFDLMHNYNFISIRQEHIFPYAVEDYVAGRYRLEPWFSAMPKKMYRTLEKFLGWHLLIVAKKI